MVDKRQEGQRADNQDPQMGTINVAFSSRIGVEPQLFLVDDPLKRSGEFQVKEKDEQKGPGHELRGIEMEVSHGLKP